MAESLATLDALRDSMREDERLRKRLHRILERVHGFSIATPSPYVDDVIDEVAYHLWRCGQSAAEEG